MRRASRVAVPLNSMCSTTWLMPLTSFGSCALPLRMNTATVLVASAGVGSATMRTPLVRVCRVVKKA